MNTKSIINMVLYPFLMIVACIGDIYSQENNGVSRIQSLYNFWEDIEKIEVKGEYAFIATGATGLRVLDISNPNSIQEISSIDTIRNCNNFYIQDSLLFMPGEGFNRITVADISNPRTPKIVTNIVVGEPLEVAIQNTTAFVAQNYHTLEMYYKGLLILDITDINQPIELGYIQLNESVNGLFIHDTLAFYGLDDSNDLAIINVSRLDHPNLLSRISLDHKIINMRLVNGILYIVPIGDGLKIFDISDPSEPETIAEFNPESRIIGIEVIENFLYAFSDDGIYLLENNGSEAPELLEHFEIGNLGAFRSFILDTLIFTGNNNPQLSIINISEEDRPQIINSIDRSGYVHNLSMRNDIAFVFVENNLDSTNGIDIIDFQDIQNPELIGQLELPNHVSNYFATCFYDDYAYMIFEDLREDRRMLYIIDISDLNSPEIINEIVYDDYIFLNPEIIGHVLFIPSSSNGIISLDLTNPEVPDETVIINQAWNHLRQAFFVDSLIITRNFDYVQVWNSEDEDNISLLSVMDPYNIQNCTYDDNNIFIVHNDMYLSIYDISDPSHPQRTVQYRSAFPPIFSHLTMEAMDAHLYCIAGEGNLNILDVSDSSSLNHIASVFPTGRPVFFVYQENIVYIPTKYSLEIYDISAALSAPSSSFILPPSSFALSPAYPNPFNSSTTIEYRVGSNSNSPVTLSLYDLSGRLVQTLVNERLMPGNYRTTLNANGLSSGVYVVRLDSSIDIGTQKIVVVK